MPQMIADTDNDLFLPSSAPHLRHLRINLVFKWENDSSRPVRFVLSLLRARDPPFPLKAIKLFLGMRHSISF
jgi:hypothetical protein